MVVRINTVGYFPFEDIMFGVCLIKEFGSGKGNLEEANVEEWSETVRKVREKYPDVKKIFPDTGKLVELNFWIIRFICLNEKTAYKRGSLASDTVMLSPRGTLTIKRTNKSEEFM